MSARNIFAIAIVAVALSPLVSVAEESDTVKVNHNLPHITARPWASLPFIDDVFPLTKEVIVKSIPGIRVSIPEMGVTSPVPLEFDWSLRVPKGFDGFCM